MSITITETCDGCGKSRELKTCQQDEHGGWRKVTELKHLCSECIQTALGKTWD